MKSFEIDKLARILGAGEVGGGVFTGVTIDSRNVKAGDCFIAIKGANFDGHDFVEQALEAGAVCAVAAKTFKPKRPVSKPIIAVDDTIEALGIFAGAYRSELKCKVIGITGSAGKTTTRQIIYHVLGKHLKCHAAQKSFNNNIGLPLTILGIDPENEAAILELGTNNPGEIEYLTRIARPDIAVITNVYEAHIENFGSIGAIIKEKSSIALGIKTAGRLIINGDITGLEEHVKTLGCDYIVFGKAANAKYSVSDVELLGLEGSFKAQGVKIEIPLPGRGNIDNAAAAFAVCREMGIGAEDFARDVKDLGGVAMRLEPMQIGKLTLISDCYNANPASMKNAAEVLANIAKDKRGRTVFIAGPMKELGEHSKKLHGEVGAKIGEAGINILIATGEWAKEVERSAKSASIGINTHIFEDTKSICNNLSSLVREDDIILVKGSRAAKLETVVDRIKEMFKPA